MENYRGKKGKKEGNVALNYIIISKLQLNKKLIIDGDILNHYILMLLSYQQITDKNFKNISSQFLSTRK